MAMARPLRVHFPGALYHITSRGDGREAIYRSDVDREDHLALLGETCERFNWQCLAYCQMGNHYHLLIQTPDANLAAGMRHLNGVYTQRFNRRHGRCGHVFQGRYNAILVESDSYLLEVSRYVVLNPVRAGLIARAEEWRWSSYRATANAASAPRWLDVQRLLAVFSADRKAATRMYERFVEDGQTRPSPWADLKAQIFLGSDDFVSTVQRLGASASCEIPRRQRRPLAQSLIAYEDASVDRDEAIVKAWESGGYTMKQIGEHFHIHYSRVSRIVARAKSKT
jgi:putative transposase